MNRAIEQVVIDEVNDALAADGPEPKSLRAEIADSWQLVAPFWPLENLIAVNPLQGLEGLPVEEALREGAAYFQQPDLPEAMQAVNRETIKWCQAFFDDGQATIAMPFREQGLYAAWRRLAPADRQLHGGDPARRRWLAALPADPEAAIRDCLERLGIAGEHRAVFLRLMLTTLAGWAAHVRYRTAWQPAVRQYSYPVSEADYLAVRLAITLMRWPEADRLLAWHAQARDTAGSDATLETLSGNESRYRGPLLRALTAQLAGAPVQRTRAPDAQLVFCIDVRSEPFRRAVEASGDYETLGFAGFFGVPVSIRDELSGDTYASCPVLLQPQHAVTEKPLCSSTQRDKLQQGQSRLSLVKRVYQSLKYTFTTPFALVEMLGPLSGLWMFLRSLTPGTAMELKSSLEQGVRPPVPTAPDLSDIGFADRCAYAAGALRMMGLTRDFAPLVVLCGHGSSTQNNAFASALDCGACGGRHGAGNARILAAMLNDGEVRKQLAGEGIAIDAGTRFVAAEHNTTTDEVEVFADGDTLLSHAGALVGLQRDLECARSSNSAVRAAAFADVSPGADPAALTRRRSLDWAQVRPEWGLARNAAFLVGPRELSRNVDLEGRAFLHSYDWRQDADGSSLTTILTAPMVVAQWINTQYLFSTLDNVAFGGGSKVTHNITGKLGVMQGNASDLMHGLPLQSVFATDTQAYHEPQRLMTVVCAPRERLDSIIAAQTVLQTLFGNGWVTLVCIHPGDNQAYELQRDLSWQPCALDGA